MDSFGDKADPFAKIYIDGKLIKTTKTVHEAGKQVTWAEQVKYVVEKDADM